MKTLLRAIVLVILAVATIVTPALTAVQRPPIEVPAAYAGGGPDQPPFGPSALRFAPNGTLWIANPADNSLTAIDKEKGLGVHLHLDNVTGITDLRFNDNGELLVLDGAAETPMLLRVTPSGLIREQRELWTTSLGRGSPPIVAEAEHDSPAPLAFSLDDGQSWQIQTGTESQPNAILTRNGARIEVKASRGVMRGIRVLADDANGLYLLAEEVADAGNIVVDATVRRYAAGGRLIGTGRIPLTEQYAYVESPVAIAADGTVYILTTKPHSAVVQELPLAPSIPEILPEHRRPLRAAAESLKATSSATPLITRSQIEANARQFLNNSTYYSQAALTGKCSGRTAPRSLGTTPGWRSSVFYDWGGGDSVADYNRLIGSGSQAGDIDTNAVEACSVGVDCSGFVTRVWALSGKLGTCGLSGVSTEITSQSLMKGDILVRCVGDAHVVLYDSPATNGVVAYESTINNGVDRVVYATSTWSRLNGYTPRRYLYVAVDPTTPEHLSSYSSPASGASGMLATFYSTWKNADNTAMTARATIRMPNGATSDYAMSYAGGATTSGALFQVNLTLSAIGSYGYAITTTSTTTGRSARYPASGFLAGPIVKGVTYAVSPTYAVCGQYPVTIRVGASLANASTVRFTVTKGNNSCSQSGYFITSGVVDLRVGSPNGAIVASASYSAGSSQVQLDLGPTFTLGSQLYYATIRNQGYWAGPILISAH